MLARVLLGPRPSLHHLRCRFNPVLFGDFTAVESGEVGLIALPPPARSNGSCSFPASRFPMWVALVGEGWIPPASDGAFPVSSIPAQGLSQSELVRTSVIYSPGLHHLTPPHSTGPSPSGWSFGSNRRRRSMVAIRDLLF